MKDKRKPIHKPDKHCSERIGCMCIRCLPYMGYVQNPKTGVWEPND